MAFEDVRLERSGFRPALCCYVVSGPAGPMSDMASLLLCLIKAISWQDHRWTGVIFQICHRMWHGECHNFLTRLEKWSAHFPASVRIEVWGSPCWIFTPWKAGVHVNIAGSCVCSSLQVWCFGFEESWKWVLATPLYVNYSLKGWNLPILSSLI